MCPCCDEVIWIKPVYRCNAWRMYIYLYNDDDILKYLYLFIASKTLCLILIYTPVGEQITAI